MKRFSTNFSLPSFALLIFALLSGCDQTRHFTLFRHRPTVPEQLVPEVLAVWPHDPNSFTEGLLWYDGFLYESSGRYGESNLRKVAPETGQILRQIDNPTNVFGEGIALVGNRIFQLTWHEQIGYIYDLDTLAQIETVSYDAEGWGLCFDGQHFFMSNGSAFIYERDPKTFAILGKFQITKNGESVSNLNELECVGDSIYANVWMTNTILRIDKVTGEVTGVIDASGLLTPQELAHTGTDGVLNGIAYDTNDDVFLITGKLWSKLFKVKFVTKISK